MQVERSRASMPYAKCVPYIMGISVLNTAYAYNNTEAYSAM